MPSFFESFKRLATGQPVFQDADHGNGPADDVHQTAKPGETAAPSQQPQDQHATPRDSSGRKIIPEVFVKRVESKPNGDKFECWGIVRNDSPQQIEAEKILLLGQTRDLNVVLRPGEERELLLYTGPIPKSESYHDAELQYKDLDGDWFAAVHTIDYGYNDEDKTYLIDELELRKPIKDIYG